MEGPEEAAKTTRDFDPPEATAPVADEAVRLQLDMVLQSSLFSQSQTFKPFSSLCGGAVSCRTCRRVKERTLATEVFDRPPTYDSASDPIVRVAAGDLRKRLAQYYVQQAHMGELHIKLPADDIALCSSGPNRSRMHIPFWWILVSPLKASRYPR